MEMNGRRQRHCIWRRAQPICVPMENLCRKVRQDILQTEGSLTQYVHKARAIHNDFYFATAVADLICLIVKSLDCFFSLYDT